MAEVFHKPISAQLARALGQRQPTALTAAPAKLTADQIASKNAAAIKGDDDDQHPTNQRKLDQIAGQHRANLQAEQRAGQVRETGDTDYQSFRSQPQSQEIHDMTYHQRALAGHFGADVKRQAIEAYNKGDTLENPAEVERAARKAKASASPPDRNTYHDRALRGELGADARREAVVLQQIGEQLQDPAFTKQGPGFVGNATRTDGSQSSTRIDPATGGEAANPVAPAAVLHQGAESSTPSKTVTSSPSTTPAGQPASSR